MIRPKTEGAVVDRNATETNPAGIRWTCLHFPYRTFRSKPTASPFAPASGLSSTLYDTLLGPPQLQESSLERQC